MNIDIVNNDITPILKGLTVLKFWAPWCSHCTALGPILETSVQGSDITLANCNVDENQSLANDAGVRSLPTTIIFKDGEEVQRFSGTKTVNEVKDLINEV